MKANANITLPTIPEKLYFTISETSELCGVKQHVLRYWEQEFPQLQPLRRGGERRYYRRQDIEKIRGIRELLYNQGFTLEGARQQFSQADKAANAEQGNVVGNQALLQDVLNECDSILSQLHKVADEII